jgi:hypothetical protein
MQNKHNLSPEPDHTIEITIKDNYVLPPKIPVLKIGETVRYRTKSPGAVTIEFPEQSPYLIADTKKTKVPGEVILTLVSANETDGFPSRCYIKFPAEKGRKPRVIGWSAKNRDAGGVHKVGH